MTGLTLRLNGVQRTLSGSERIMGMTGSMPRNHGQIMIIHGVQIITIIRYRSITTCRPIKVRMIISTAIR